MRRRPTRNPIPGMKTDSGSQPADAAETTQDAMSIDPAPPSCVDAQPHVLVPENLTDGQHPTHPWLIAIRRPQLLRMELPSSLIGVDLETVDPQTLTDEELIAVIRLAMAEQGITDDPLIPPPPPDPMPLWDTLTMEERREVYGYREPNDLSGTDGDD